ncbi:MAG: TolC family protein [Planctomycetota bacterium]
MKPPACWAPARARILGTSLVFATAACHSYVPQPVDLDAHLREFLHRTAAAPARPSKQLGTSDDPKHLARETGRELAKLLHPDARVARLRANVATVARDNAGLWEDPQLQVQVQNILESSVPHRWVPMAQVGLTLPINGRLAKERALADRRREEALIEAWRIEQQVANELDRSWVLWTAAAQVESVFAETCDNLEDLEQLALALAKSGSLTRPEARVFTLERRQRQAGSTFAAASAHAARLDVHRALGLHPQAPLVLLPAADSVDGGTVQPFVPIEQREAALRQSPRLLQRLRAHAAAEADVELQVRRQWPDIQIWPGWQEEDAQPRASFGFNVPLPIFTGNDPEIARARAERELQGELVRMELETLLQELAIAEVRLDAARIQRQELQDLVQLAREQLEDGRRLAQAGQFDPLLMLDALLRLHDVQLQTIQARRDEAIAATAINDLLCDPASRTDSATESATDSATAPAPNGDSDR